MADGNNVKVWQMLLYVLGWTTVGLAVLTILALTTSDPFDKSVEMSVKWAREILGIAGIVAGFLGLSTATRLSLTHKAGGDDTPPATKGNALAGDSGTTAQDRIVYASGGMVGVLAGATLLGVGDWYIPAALALTSTGIAAALARQFWNS